MTKNVIVNLTVSGVHNWRDMPDTESLSPVSFLKRDHMHVFHIQAKKSVSHNDRDVEIILLKEKIIKFLRLKFEDDSNGCDILYFGSRSCEDIAEILVEELELYYCSVLEDGNFGAEVYK